MSLVLPAHARSEHFFSRYGRLVRVQIKKNYAFVACEAGGGRCAAGNASDLEVFGR